MLVDELDPVDELVPDEVLELDGAVEVVVVF